MKVTLFFLCVLSVIGCSDSRKGPFIAAPQGTDVGNGGDYVRAVFFQVGEATLAYLTQDASGKVTLAKVGISVEALRSSLSIQSVHVTDGDLKDDRGSDVDAIGVPGSITLKKSAWIDHFEKERDVYYLVFHEMLRANGVNDDDYVISKALSPFPSSFRVKTRLAFARPVIDSQLVASAIPIEMISLKGTGCENASFYDFDIQKNTFDITLGSYRLDSKANETEKVCVTTLPILSPKGKKLVISQIDLSGSANLRLGAKAELKINVFSTKLFELGNEEQIVPKPIASRTRGLDAARTSISGGIQFRVNSNFESGCQSAEALHVSSVTSLTGDGEVKIDHIVYYFELADCQ